ncbi:DUF5675 family protein [Shewanella sp. 3_MG-2023]|uniref:DUF5675 family protein n=1 Tax=Shewanella sp. 3_MG-2023 TaxID=3062635 RepID=UPI0026E2865C|nr:DUF5675 family protein [Shewanella sp. 3_MG-2023]MDO6775805.1 DUF5675 family protein [Shewanella sp. 3_MG-2023]
MSILRINRIKQFGETTLGKLSIDGESKSWFVLEPGGPDSTIEGSDKRISTGTYKISPYSSPKYLNVYELKNIPGRTKILIHAGNYHENTEGCIMPGLSWGLVNQKGHYYVSSSRIATNEIFKKIKELNINQVVIKNGFGS